MISCANCGAEIEKDAPKCPYCGFINKEGAEKKFQADLDEIREDIKEVRKEPSKALVKGLSGGMKVIIVTAIILLILAIVVVSELILAMKDRPKEFLSPEEEAYASAYRETAGEQLAEAYENKDIAAMAQIYDTAYSKDRVNLWGVDHYEASYASSCYMKLQALLPLLDQGGIDKHTAEEITYYCFYFYYRGYGDDGAEIFDPIREDEIIPIITDRLMYTTEDMEAFREEVYEAPNVNRSKVHKVTKKHYKNYR